MARYEPKVTLSSHTIEVREPRQRDPLVLGQFSPGTTFRSAFEAFVRELEARHHNDEASRHLIKVERVEGRGSSISGILQVGPYGYGADLVHSDTFERLHRQSPKEATLHPFYFLLHAPDESTKALLVLQRFGGRGVQTLLLHRMREYFRQLGFVLDIHTHIPGAVMKHLFDGDIKTINIRSYRVPSDLASKVHLDGNIEDKAVFRQVIQARLGESVPRPDFMRPAVLKDIMYGRRRLVEFLDDAEGTVDELKVTVVYNGTQRTIDLTYPERIMPYIDISDEVEMGPDGHPVYDHVHETATALVRDILAEMGRERHAD